MGTRCTIQFRGNSKKITIYQSMDGMPSSTIPKLQKFLKWNGSRCDDIEYTAANFVFYSKFVDMIPHVEYWKEDDAEKPQSIKEYFDSADDKFGITHTGYGITDNEHQDEQYFYIVDLDAKCIIMDEERFAFAANQSKQEITDSVRKIKERRY